MNTTQTYIGGQKCTVFGTKKAAKTQAVKQLILVKRNCHNCSFFLFFEKLAEND